MWGDKMKATYARILVLAAFFATVHSAALLAEIYRGIGPLDTLADVKAKFPGAKYERFQPAWAQPGDALYEVSGPGLSGTIIIKFQDLRPFFKQALATQLSQEDRKIYEDLAGRSEEVSLSVEWVRWIPAEPIPLQRFVSKYGKPDASGYTDSELEPYREWTTRGIVAFLSSSELLVVRVDFAFTVAERRQTYQEKYGFVPDYLK